MNKIKFIMLFLCGALALSGCSADGQIAQEPSHAQLYKGTEEAEIPLADNLLDASHGCSVYFNQISCGEYVIRIESDRTVTYTDGTVYTKPVIAAYSKDLTSFYGSEHAYSLHDESQGGTPVDFSANYITAFEAEQNGVTYPLICFTCEGETSFYTVKDNNLSSFYNTQSASIRQPLSDFTFDASSLTLTDTEGDSKYTFDFENLKVTEV